MAAGALACARGAINGANRWMAKHDNALMVLSTIVLIFLFLFHSLGEENVPLSAGLVNIMVIVLVGFLFVVIAWKGLVPAAMCGLGVVLLHSAIILQYYPSDVDVLQHLSPNAEGGTDIVEEATGIAITMHFLLGVGMVAMSMVVAYSPKLMFARNRPDENESEWSKYPIWCDNVRLAGRFSDGLVPAQSLMDDRDKYMLWRYEYILANIYGTLHLVRPDGLVPKTSTELMRDRESGLLMGVGKYDGYFV